MVKVLYIAGPVIVLLMLSRFLTGTTRRERLAVILGWLFPGLGHIYLGERRRGLFLGGLIVGTFLAGLVLAHFRCISPFDRHPIWAVAHFFGGLLSLGTWGATQSLHIEADYATYQVGCLYVGIATLLNILVIIDAFDHAEARPDLGPAGAAS
ncbi:MAG: hypothetical protein KDB53_08185 [Planctomycetes bacterium]|nr:hypothetical protein [Planctomycetota bacterium]